MNIHVVKIGGAIVENKRICKSFLKQFITLEGAKILVHGGGKELNKLSHSLGLSVKMIDGRRVTDKETLKLATMVYAGDINKRLVAILAEWQCAIGLCGADANILKSKRREKTQTDFGFVGDTSAEMVDTDSLLAILNMNWLPVLSAITHDGHGQLLNTNADTVASTIAQALTLAGHQISLSFLFEQNGVLKKLDNPDDFFPKLDASLIKHHNELDSFHKGILPKLFNAQQAVMAGVQKVYIKHWQNVDKDFGTQII